MIHLSPKKIDVVEVEVVSRGRGGDGDPVERRVNLGIFTEDVTEQDLQEAIAKYDLYYELLGTISMMEGRARISKRSFQMTSGAIFDSADECCRYRSKGITYSDIEHLLSPEDKEDHDYVEI